MLKVLSFNSIGRRLALLVISFGVALICVVGLLAWLNMQSMVDARRHEIKSLVDAAYGIVDQQYKAVQAGTVPEAEGKARAIAALRTMRYEPNGFFVIYDDRIVTLLNPAVPAAEGTDMSGMKDPTGFNFTRAIYDAAKAADAGGYIDYQYRKNSKDEAFFPKTSFSRRFAPWGWTVFTGVYMDDIAAEGMMQAIKSAGIGLAALAFCSLLAFVIVRGITRRLHALAQAMTDLASGKVNVELPELRSGDEIDDMARSVAVFRENAAERERLSVAAVAQDAASVARHAEVETLIGSFQTKISGILTTVRSSISALASTASGLTGVAADASNRAQSVNGISTANSHSIQSVAGGAEELSSSVREIGQLVARATTVISKASTLTQQTDTAVAGLAVNARTIGDVVNLIQAIAEQTNLLALNASIESARAGDAGRGFAVVANEVKALAGQTAKATDEIRRQIEAMQSSTTGAVDAISAIVATMADVQAFVGSISEAVEQQNSATGEISQSIQSTARGVSDVSNEFSNVVTGIDHANRMAADVAAATGTLATETEALDSEVNTFLRRVART